MHLPSGPGPILWNDHGERYWVKWHFKTLLGIQTLSNEEAARTDEIS